MSDVFAYQKHFASNKLKAFCLDIPTLVSFRDGSLQLFQLL